MKRLGIKNKNLALLCKGLKLFLGIISVFAVQLILSQNAFAYLDPGTGSYVFQVLVAALIGGLFTIKIFWQKIKNFLVHYFSNHFPKKQRP